MSRVRLAWRWRNAIWLRLPLVRKSWWWSAIGLAVLAGAVLVWFQADWADVRLYDRVVANNLRSDSPATARFVLDARVPLSISREQTLALQALAMERLASMQAEGILLDAQIALRNYRKQTFAACLPEDSPPLLCSLRDEARCLSLAGRARRAPLDLDLPAMQRLTIPVPLADRSPPPYDWLFGPALPKRMISPELALGRDGVVRQMHAAWLPAMRSDTSDTCGPDHAQTCLAIRFSDPRRVTALPFSQLASCDEQRWRALASKVVGRHVVLQLTADEAPEDVHLTPLARQQELGYGLLPGGRILEDGLATSLAQDGPRRAPWWLVLPFTGAWLVLVIALFSYWRAASAVTLLVLLFAALWWIAPHAYPYAYWPVTAMMGACLAAALTLLAGHMWLNTRATGVLARFMPPQVRQVLLEHGSEHFAGRQVRAVVLLSDLAGYTTVTALLPSPKILFDLINGYLDAVTTGMQARYGAWLEAYVGDMVCYYWPQLDEDPGSGEVLRRRAIAAALDLLARQQAFFAALPTTLPPDIDEDGRRRISSMLFAGIALSEGEVFMGELGPSRGVRKFSILGDPVNVTSRLEALTRVFTAKLIVTQELLPAALEAGLLARRLASVQLKGRLEPADVWALHRREDGVDDEMVADWHTWLAAVEQGNLAGSTLARFERDRQTILGWCSAGLWRSERRCFALDSK